MGLVDTSPLIFKARCFGACYSGAVTIGVTDVGFKPFIPQGEARTCGFPPDYGLPCQGWVYGEIVSYPLVLISMWIFSFFHLLSM